MRTLSALGKSFLAGSFRALPLRSGTFARRWLAWEFLRGDAETITFQRDGFIWSVFTHDIVGRSLYIRGDFELEPLQPLLAWLKANRPRFSEQTTIVNIGANIGDTALPLSKATGKRIIACEPVPRTFELLRRNVDLNQMSANIDCRQVAIATKAGTIEMLCPRDSGHSEVKSSHGKQGFNGLHLQQQCQVTQVPSLPLDQLMESCSLRPEEVALVWSDTQGFESEVIASGATLWKVGVPLWVEVAPQALEIHGGLSRFESLCRQHFRQLILDEQFMQAGREQSPHPIDRITEVLRKLQQGKDRRGRGEQDVLLIP
ncbi:MAG: FkbM family methyltransferase [Pirellulaceae bacterium]|nr:FkbM family methyltransferase [Pirellulaceae bacterium]